jgi:hypothetical protein
VRTIFSSIRRRAGISASNRKARCGAVGFIQRFSENRGIGPEADSQDTLQLDEPLLAELYSASISGRVGRENKSIL